jgi:hypothetical protein
LKVEKISHQVWGYWDGGKKQHKTSTHV